MYCGRTERLRKRGRKRKKERGRERKGEITPYTQFSVGSQPTIVLHNTVGNIIFYRAIWPNHIAQLVWQECTANLLPPVVFNDTGHAMTGV